MKAKSETYDVELHIPTSKSFGTMHVINRETGEQRSFAGVLRRRGPKDLLKAAEWHWNNGVPL